jgi:serine/threonine protein kinase
LDEEKLLFSAFVNRPIASSSLPSSIQRLHTFVLHPTTQLQPFGTAFESLRNGQLLLWSNMDRSRYQMLYGLNLTKDQQEKVRQKVEKALHVLHDAGFVHGDLRDTNILMDFDSLESDDVKIHFVDFDWAGRIGEAKYPSDINGITVKRPEGAEGGKL